MERAPTDVMSEAPAVAAGAPARIVFHGRNALNGALR
jgi:hypothetical protein